VFVLWYQLIQCQRVMNESRRYYLVSLGCPKNTVDSEGMGFLLKDAGYRPVAVPDAADLLIVNTCGFIQPAREEALGVLRDLSRDKRPYQRLVAAGCYAQLYPQELIREVPGLDGVIGTRRWMDIVQLVSRLESRTPEEAPGRQPICHLPETPVVGQDVLGLPRVAIQGASAYLKLADGCRRSCAFCAIPLIKGTAVSRPTEAILDDARWLAELGIQEIVLIAQDTTGYGEDLGMKGGLSDLLEQLVVAVPQVPWIRLMYGFPGPKVERLAQTMAAHQPQILPYLDIPLQHAHPDVLRRMRRPADVAGMRRMIRSLRVLMPDIAIRTTFITGFPGETESEFQTLVDFVETMAFDRVGVFTYYHQAGTPGAELDDDVPQVVKEERRDRLMEVQQAISLAKNRSFIGRTLGVLIEGQGDGISVGRSYRDAPEIDCLVLVQADLPVGRIVPVRITDAIEYDLVGLPDY